MVQYIKEFNNKFDEDFCKLIISRHQSHTQEDELIYWRDHCTNPQLKKLASDIEMVIFPCIQEYFECYKGLLGLKDIVLDNYSINKQSPGHFDNLHYDTPLYEYKGTTATRPFICMIYLNDSEFSGGQVIFPVQKYILEPKCGKIALFPTSLHFPHMVSSISEGERYSIRVTIKIHSDTLSFD